MRDPLPTPDQWPPTVELRRSPESTATHHAALLEVLRHDPMYPLESGRGIVWVGGGRYWPGIVAGVRLIRELGCTLPVEVWHRGSCEPVDIYDVRGLGVEVVDSDIVSRGLEDNRITPGDETRGGWENKLYALTHTAFEQAMFLDADAYCVSDPTPLFDLLTPTAPFLFWEDLPGLDLNINWPRVLPEVAEAAASVPAVQGGQLLIERRHAVKLLHVSHWLCQHSDYYFAWMYGDQDTWRVGLSAGLCGWRSLGAADWRQPAFVCGHEGTEYIVHRCQAKLFPDITPKPFAHLPLEGRIFKHFADVVLPQPVT